MMSPSLVFCIELLDFRGDETNRKILRKMGILFAITLRLKKAVLVRSDSGVRPGRL